MKIQRKSFYKIIEFMYNGTYINGWDGGDINTSTFFIKYQFKRVLHIILREHVNLVCAARTDKGVHSCYNICNFTTYHNIDNNKLVRSMNALLPEYIRIQNIINTHIFFSSRFWTLYREYEYMICLEKYHNPLLLNTVYYPKCHFLDFNAILQSLTILKTVKNISGLLLKSFSGNIYRTIDNAEYSTRILFGSLVHCFRFKAKSFAHHQIRIIMYFILQVGRHKLSINQFQNIIDKSCNMPKMLVPSCGLCLINVYYIK
jgi:tRNA pseudouridine38-40 synthase